ncbi:MAG: shikimate kinase [Zetaproteobacteria bacterium]|nr:shikimate kinase [Zetaproteobacteria bacterium]
MNLILIGPMGAGKSTLAKLLAHQLQLAWIDLDAAIVAKAGCAIPEIFQTKGEGAFRDLESELLQKCCTEQHAQIIATGGGAVLRAQNRAIMQQYGAVVWLDIAPEISSQRIAGDTNRPLLAGASALERAQTLALERNPLYASIAAFTINTGEYSPQASVARIVTFYRGLSA